MAFETVIVSIFSAIGGTSLTIFLGRKWIEKKFSENLEEFKSNLVKELDIIRHELNLIRSSFEGNIEYVFEYFSIFYRYYRLCQEAALVDIVKTKEGKFLKTRERFIDNLDQVVEEWMLIEGRIRLILPDNIVVIHEKSIEAFNAFRGLVKSYKKEQDKPRKELESAFKEVHKIKDEMASALRTYLRTEKMSSGQGKP